MDRKYRKYLKEQIIFFNYGAGLFVAKVIGMKS